MHLWHASLRACLEARLAQDEHVDAHVEEHVDEYDMIGRMLKTLLADKFQNDTENYVTGFSYWVVSKN